MSNNLAEKSLHIGRTQYNNLENHIETTTQRLQDLLNEVETITSLEGKITNAKKEKNNFVLENLTEAERELLQQFAPGFNTLTEHQRDTVLDQLKRRYATKVELEIKPFQNEIFRDKEKQSLWTQILAMIVNRSDDSMNRIIGNIGR